MRRLSLIALAGLLAVGAAPALAAPAGPTTLDRPDLMDVSASFSGTPRGKVTSSSASLDAEGLDLYSYSYSYTGSGPAVRYQWRTSEAEVKANGYLAGSADSTRATLSWSLYEPDNIRRKGARATVRQGDWVALSVFMSGATSTSIRETPALGCKGVIKVVDADGDPRARWRLKCSRDALAAVGLSDDQIAAMKSIFGGRMLMTGRSAR